ncbi:hypothetical protein L484_022320 [Morus notabilis]|uniref:F-box associated beta-propeller type 1 domain-containing protein n=2 Tax=Morus notabilis TaxID=981085 RepID=W9QJB7_9ROSA|nr:hypothetical protein L484_022320 [Morus notabilis]
MGATEGCSLLTIFGYDDDDNDRIRCSTEVLNFPIDPAKHIESLCYCDGIIFIGLSASNLTVEGVLFNPAIKESRVLPKPCFAGSFMEMGKGFGYDHRTNDYKVVTFGFVRHGHERRAEVYGMATDSWREIEMQIQTNGAFSGAEVYCEGVFYWRMADYNHMILSFDMSDEVFRRIPLPNNLQELAIDLDIELAVWNGSVAFFYFPGETEDPTLFVMNDRVDDARGSCYWVKHLTIGPFEGIARPWIFWKNDELLMVRKGTEGWLVSYNVRSKKIRGLPIQGERGRYFRFLYVGSLVSVQRRGQAQLQI